MKIQTTKKDPNDIEMCVVENNNLESHKNFIYKIIVCGCILNTAV